MTKSVAKQELAFCKMAFNNGNENYKQKRFYKCKFCGYYHLTSK
jgi:rubrerythrin